MNAEFLARLTQAKTEAEKDWLLTELSLSVLSPELRVMALAAAVPHWFDADILAALQPELAGQAERLYKELQELSYVEVFPGRGYNIHERTRKVMLQQLWETDPEEFKRLTRRLVEYFAADETNRIEQIYHWVVADFVEGSSQFTSYITNLDHNYRRSEAEALLATLQEQINRVPDSFAADLVYWDGNIHYRFYEATQALEKYQTALSLYQTVGARLGEANTLQAQGDVLQFLKQSQQALEKYQTALTIYQTVGDRLGEANTLQAQGDLETDPNLAIAKYQTARQTYIEIGDQYSQARILAQSIAPYYRKLNQPQAVVAALRQSIQICKEMNYIDFIPQLETEIEEISGEIS